MKILNDFLNYIQGLNKSDFDRYSRLFLLLISFFAAAGIYYVYSESVDLIQKINSTKRLSLKTVNIIKEHFRMKKTEEKLKQLLEQHKDFNMNTFFEQFCSAQNLTPEAWNEVVVRDLPGSDKFDEVSLTAAFKNQTTKKLVEVLDEISKKEIIYIKDVNIEHEEKGKLAFEITLATKRLKKSI